MLCLQCDLKVHSLHTFQLTQAYLTVNFVIIVTARTDVTQTNTDLDNRQVPMNSNYLAPKMDSYFFGFISFSVVTNVDPTCT